MKQILYMLFMLLPWPLPAQMIYTVGGNGSEYYYGDGGPATAAQIGNPYDVTSDVLLKNVLGKEF